MKQLIIYHGKLPEVRTLKQIRYLEGNGINACFS